MAPLMVMVSPFRVPPVMAPNRVPTVLPSTVTLVRVVVPPVTEPTRVPSAAPPTVTLSTVVVPPLILPIREPVTSPLTVTVPMVTVPPLISPTRVSRVLLPRETLVRVTVPPVILFTSLEAASLVVSSETFTFLEIVPKMGAANSSTVSRPSSTVPVTLSIQPAGAEWTIRSLLSFAV